MPKTRILKRNDFVKKKSLLNGVGKGLIISAIAWAAAFGGFDLLKKRSELKAQKARQVELQNEAYKRGLERRRLEKIARDEEKERDVLGMINAAKKRGMLPRYYKRSDGSLVVADYIDPPSTQGVKRVKPVETTQAEIIRRELGIKKKNN
jgi:hypothetical protein